MPQATLTSKGQVTIPVEVRKRLGLKTGDRVDFDFLPDGKVAIRTKKLPFEALRGFLRKEGQRRISIREMDEAIGKAVAEKFERAARSRSK